MPSGIYIRTEEAKKNMNLAHKGKRLGMHHSEESKAKMRLASSGKYPSKETRYKMSLAQMGNKKLLGFKHSEEFKRKMSERLKGNKINLGRHPTQEAMQKMLKRLKDRPTLLEKEFQSMINKYKLSYKYVGDGSFLIGYKNPDFVNINGEKICIEVANHYHHKDPYKENRIKHFAQWGWKCIVFFEDELDEKNVLKQLESIEVVP